MEKFVAGNFYTIFVGGKVSAPENRQVLIPQAMAIKHGNGNPTHAIFPFKPPFLDIQLPRLSTGG